MKEYIIDLFGDITNWGYSRNYIKYYLDQAGKNPVRLRVTSFGGNVNEAIAISKLLEEHGDVTVEFIGFNASAVTWMAFGAKRIVAYEDTLWLAHKSSVAVSFYGAFNADSIEEKIKELQNKKQMAEALDLIIAKKYADYTGKTIEEIFGLMGESKWLTAHEAKDWGFVNEVLPGKMNKNSSAATNLFEAMGLPPVPEVKTDNTKEDTLVNRIVDGIKGIFKNEDTNHDKIINTVMNKEFLSVNKVLNIEGFEVADNKVTLTVEQMKIINTALTNAGQEIDQADNKYNGLLAKIDGLSDVVKNAADEDAKIEAIRDIVNKIPASVVNDNNGGNGNRTFNDVAVDPINRFDEE
ncbi:Clp protease ClpP [Bacteroides caecigallinarum]|uniref:Clp protease ClpP n=1 Tax=Bacteroides caecigallinarum TaxID=1411144 RepID=UPI001F47E451|nr:Clp protease ClpP [Bacteroides caecigallinarum]MCF2551788.1 Clp protease ClpP [Bacteroides caecigallinarum]